MESNVAEKARSFLPRSGLAELVRLLIEKGYDVVAPTLRDGLVSMRSIKSAEELPTGLRDQQSAGHYRVENSGDELTFNYVVGPDGVKRYLFPPDHPLMQFFARDDRFEIESGPPQAPRMAFLGVRPCELAAMRVQDRVFAFEDPDAFRCESDPWYSQVRRESIYIAVNCTRPGGSCFCDSWKTGPEAHEGFDLALTELRDGFVVQIGSNRGQELATQLPLRAATSAELELADLKLTSAREHMGRQLNVEGLKQVLDENIEHPLWEQLGERCLACGNCTMVCPTCFCSTVTDATDLADGRITRTRQWESCFTQQFTYISGGPDRSGLGARYRHWLRHKLCTWWDQFNSSGCVGCGRCITWCPVAIDLTEEVKKLSRSESTPPRKVRRSWDGMGETT